MLAMYRDGVKRVSLWEAILAKPPAKQATTIYRFGFVSTVCLHSLATLTNVSWRPVLLWWGKAGAEKEIPFFMALSTI
jgi:hypothetical protein